jgi:hypothetical protein
MSHDFDEDRHLCPDGSCIGVLGADGRCKVCGRAGVKGDAPYREMPVDGEPDEPDDVLADEPGDEDEQDEPGDDDRRLCPDGSCIGVVGDDGRCRVCGKSAS